MQTDGDEQDKRSQTPAFAPRDWDQATADSAIGKTVLVGITYVAADKETVLRQAQYYGKIIRARRDDGIAIECAGADTGEIRRLPPDMTVFTPANAGEYRLRSTGDVVVDPDYITTWTIVEKSSDRP